MDYYWKSDFTPTILKRGEEYFKSGKIFSLEFVDSENVKALSSTSGGDSSNEPYKIQVRKTKNGTIRYTCSCPYSLNCKHEAAVCFALENKGFFKGSEISSLIKKINSINTSMNEQEALLPLSDFFTEDNNYHFYDLKKITQNIKISQNNYDKALQLVSQNIISLDGVSNFQDKPDEYFFQFSIDGHSANLVISPYSITSARCLVPGCHNIYSPHNFSGEKKFLCSHNIACLILADEWFKKENPGDETDSCGNQIFSFFRDSLNNEIKISDEENFQNSAEVEKSILKFEPYIINENNYLFVGFMAGPNGDFIIKDLPSFFSAYKNNGLYKISKSDFIDFSKTEWTDISLQYLNFACAIVENEIVKERIKDDSSITLYAEKVSKGFTLYGQRLDDFFDISKNLSIVNKQGSSYIPLKNENTFFTENDLSLELNIHPELNEKNQVTKLTCSGQIPELLHGSHFEYYLEDGNCFRISSDLSEKLNRLSKLAQFSTFINFSVGRKKISYFMNNIYPWLKTFCSFTETDMDKIQNLIIPPPVFVFYLDYENEKLVCSPKAFYKKQTEMNSGATNEKYSEEYEITDYIFGAPKIHFRDYETESQILEMLYKYFLIDEEDKTLSCSDSDAIFSFLQSGISELMFYGEVQRSESLTRLKIHKHIKPSIKVNIGSGLLNLDITCDELTKKELLEVLDGMRRKKKFIRLKSGDFVFTQNPSLEELNKIIESLDISNKDFIKEKIQIPAFRALYLDFLLDNCSKITSERNKKFHSLIKEFQAVDDSLFEVPSSLKPIMRNYQVYGYKWLCTLKHYHFGGILADDMGLGKTLQTISLLLSAKENGEKGTSIIICPSSLIYNWASEFKKFAPEISYQIISGTSSERKELISAYENFDVLITSYDLLKRDFTEYENKMFLYQIIDEAQFIKNTQTNAAKSVKIIQAEYRLALTGTPIENRLSELWSIFDYLMPGFLFNATEFRNNFEIPITKFENARQSQELKQMVSPFILRRLKKDVLTDLPEKTEEIYFSQMEEEQKKLYDAQAIKLIDSINKTDDKIFSTKKIQFLAELTKIRQICCDPSLLFENYKGSSAKREACIQLINQGIQGDHKMLVFSQWTSMLDLLKTDLEAQGISYFEITGKTNKQTRFELIEKFNSDDTPVFLISLKAGGTGLNLTGADIVIHYDPWWNLAVENQATDRAYRIGQKKNVTVYKLIAKDTIEEKIVELQDRKKDLSEQILAGESNSLASLSKEDLLSLIN